MLGFFPLPWSTGCDADVRKCGTLLQQSLFYLAVWMIGVPLSLYSYIHFALTFAQITLLQLLFLKPQFLVLMYNYEGFAIAAAFAARDLMGSSQAWRLVGAVMLAAVSGGLLVASVVLVAKRLLEKKELGVLIGVDALEVVLLLVWLPHVELLENFVQALSCASHVTVLSLLLAIEHDPAQSAAPVMAEAASLINLVITCLLFLNTIRAERHSIYIVWRRMRNVGIILYTGHGPMLLSEEQAEAFQNTGRLDLIKQQLFQDLYEKDNKRKAGVVYL
eukprot:tig00021504_g21974.t1